MNFHKSIDTNIFMCYTLIVARERQEDSKMDENEMTTLEFKTLIEMVIMIVEGSKDKDEVLEKLKNLTIIKETTNK